MSAHIEGQEFLEQIKAKQDAVKQLPGIDMKFYIPYSKVRIAGMECWSYGLVEVCRCTNIISA